MASKPKTKKTEPKKKVVKTSTIAADQICKVVFSGNMPMTQDRMASARALTVLRTNEMKKEPQVEYAVMDALREAKSKVFKTVVDIAIQRNLRLIDAYILMEMLMNESALLAVWEYENIDAADEILAAGNPLEAIGEGANEMLSLLNALGGEKCDEDSDEEEED